MSQDPPPQMALYTGNLVKELDIDLAAQHLCNFLNSCIAEMKLAVQAIGRKAMKDLNRSDLVTVDKDLAEFMNIRYAASRRSTPVQ